jgi:hypothetical protein
MKITEMLMVGEKVRPANISEEVVRLLLEKENEYVMVRDRDGILRILKAKK